MATIFIDNKEYNICDSNNLLHVCLSLGFDIPYFCWHPALGSIGICRQCTVKQYHDFKDTSGKLVVSCMTPITDGLIVSIHDSEAVEFRKNIIELLMTNHPHDCPVCEEGGSCHLQDMTVMTKHYIRKYRFEKRTHKNQNLGHFIKHEMNRCISCYRCVRYYKDYSDGTDFGVFGISNNVYFGRFKEGSLESEFSGNLIDICPTGVFTDKTQSETYTRKWDLQYAPSICQHCCIGCNISVGERYGEICKIENRYHRNINRYFLCDLGRFSYGYSNLKNRPRWSMKRKSNGKWDTIESIKKSIKLVSDSLNASSKIMGIGSSRASLESNYALQKLVGQENFSIGILQDELDCVELIGKILKDSGIYTPTLREIEKNYDTILVIGEDITQTSPMMALSIRQSIKRKSKIVKSFKNVPKWHALALKNLPKDKKNKLFVINAYSTKLDDISEIHDYFKIDDQVQLCFQIAHEIDKDFFNCSNLNESEAGVVKKIVVALLSSKNPLIISGSHYNCTELIQAAYNIAKALKNVNKKVGLVLLTSNSNSLGVSLLKGISLEEVVSNLSKEDYNSLIILENDLCRYLSKAEVLKLFNNIKNVIVIDHLNTDTMRMGKITLPATNFFESSGTIVNYEGRAQRFFQVYDANFYNSSHLLNSWMWLHLIKCKLYKQSKFWNTLDDVIESMCSENDDFKKLKFIAPHASFTVLGQKLARSSHRSSGRTSMRSHINVHEISQPEDKNSMFSFSMEGCQQIYKHSSYIPFLWMPGWNSIQVLNKFQKEINSKSYCWNSGMRLFLHDSNKSMPWFKNLSFTTVKNVNYYVVPCYFLLGSEQLSQFSPVIQKNMVHISGIMNKEDANNLSIQSGSKINFICCEIKFTITVHVSSKIQSKQLGLPLGTLNFPLCLNRKKVVELCKIIV